MVVDAKDCAQEVKRLYEKTTKDPNFLYYHVMPPGSVRIENHSLVSIYQGAVIGFIGYYVEEDTVYGLRLMHFTDTHNYIFGRDAAVLIKQLMRQYRKVSFFTLKGNPAEKVYDRLFPRYGGRIVGTMEQAMQLYDGKYYDIKLYEYTNTQYTKTEATP
jgi:hypothetical protein